jgi:DNA polymerase III sliding clamp (beta) subunit (PCNA family)
VKIDTNVLRRGYDLVKAGIATRSPLAMLNMLRITKAPGSFRLMGSDSYQEWTWSAEHEGDEAFDVCVSQHQLAAALGVAGDEVDLRIAQGKLLFSSGRAKVRAAVMDGEAYPVIQTQGEQFVSVSCERPLGQLFESVQFLCNDKSVLTYEQGVSVQVREGALHVCGGGAAAIATNAAPIEGDAPVVASVMPSTVLRRLGRAQVVGLEVSDRLFRLHVEGGLRVLCTKIDIVYPNIGVIFRAPMTRLVSIGRVGLVEAVRAMSAMNRSQQHSYVRIEHSAEESVLRTEHNGEEFRVAIQAEGDDVSVAFNPAVLLPVLEHAVGENVGLQWSEKGTAYQMKEGAWTVAMAPMRV